MRTLLLQAAGHARQASVVSSASSLWVSVARAWQRATQGSFYPDAVTICNCGADFGTELPRPELLSLERRGAEGTLERRMQAQGAALYWHLATTRGSEEGKDGEKGEKGEGEADPFMLRGKDV